MNAHPALIAYRIRIVVSPLIYGPIKPVFGAQIQSVIVVTMAHHDHSNQVVSEDKLSQMVSRADKDATGCISEDDFLEAFDWLMSQGQDERDYMAIFNMLVG